MGDGAIVGQPLYCRSVCRRSLRVTGRVQGVGYRYFARNQAMAWGVCGWVRNESGDDVIIEAQGPEKDLDSFCEALKQGPAPGCVSGIAVNDITTVDGESGFSIRY